MSIPTSTIILYKDSKIIPSRNFVVDSLADYLSSLTKLTISSFQYQRQHLEMEIKIDKTQVWQEFEALNNYNYLSIQNSDSTRVVYYFITGKRQVAQDTIALKLYMDTANTFKWNVDFIPTDRTSVLREHKDRLSKTGNIVSISMEAFTLPSFDIPRNSIFYLEDADSVRITCIANNGEQFDGDDVFIIDLRPYDSIANTYLENGFEPTKLILEDLTTLNITDVRFFDKFYDIVRKIDYYSEGVNPVLYKRELGLLEDKKNNIGWNLLYRNSENVGSEAIDCFCIPDENTTFTLPASSHLIYSDFEDGKYYLFVPWGSASYYLKDNDDNSYSVGRTFKIANIYYWNCVQIRRSGTKIYVRKCRFPCFNTGEITDSRENIGAEREITSIDFEVDEIKYYKTNSAYNPSVPTTPPTYFPSSNGLFSASSSTDYDLKIIEEVDRVDSKLIKIIALPYFPTSYNWISEKMSIEDDTWTYNSGKNSLELNDLDIHFTAIIETEVQNPLNIFSLGSLSPSSTDLRNDQYESKLFHSDFYQPKFIYDSFGFVFQMEKINEDEFIPSTTFQFEFIMTSTINSKFMFRFPDYVLKMSTQDYDNILPVARNNERPIYNSAYITYLRTAYRYDLKNIYENSAFTKYDVARDTWQSGIAVNQQYLGNNATGMFTTIMNFSGTLLNSIITLRQKERNLEAKMESLKAQANSVQGSDDLDLLEAYSSNRAKLVVYEVSPRMKELLADLFYYYGYTTNELKIPTLTTRLWFNYIQCELETLTTGNNIPEELMDNIKQRYSIGITFLHKVNGGWNFEQDKENWEVSIL